MVLRQPVGGKNAKPVLSVTRLRLQDDVKMLQKMPVRPSDSQEVAQELRGRLGRQLEGLARLVEEREREEEQSTTQTHRTWSDRAARVGAALLLGIDLCAPVSWISDAVCMLGGGSGARC
eukprot:3306435-Rhodomonas_salina.1